MQNFASFHGNTLPFRSVMITGGAGFIGSRVVSLLSTLSCRSIVVDNLSVGLPLPEKSASVIPLEADIRDREQMQRIFDEFQPDAVLHLAAIHHIPTCEKNPHLAFDANVMGTQVVIDAAAAAGTKHIVLASSGAVYDWIDGPLSEETSPLRARDVYATTKLTNEYQLATWAERTESRARVARIFNTIGNNDPNAHLIPDIMSQLQTGREQCTIHLGNIDRKRDYIYVDDTAAALVTLLAGIRNGPAYDVFNVCRGEDYTVAELVHMMGDILHTRVTIEQDAARMRKVDRFQQLGDPTKLQRIGNWQAASSLRDALAAMLSRVPVDA